MTICVNMILVSWKNTLKVHLFYCFGGCRLSGAIREPKTTAPAVQNHLMYRIIGKHDPRCKKKEGLCGVSGRRTTSLMD